MVKLSPVLGNMQKSDCI